MDQLILVAIGATLLYRRHVLARESLSTRLRKFVEGFGNPDTAEPATSGKGVFYVRIGK